MTRGSIPAQHHHRHATWHWYGARQQCSSINNNHVCNSNVSLHQPVSVCISLYHTQITMQPVSLTHCQVSSAPTNLPKTTSSQSISDSVSQSAIPASPPYPCQPRPYAPGPPPPLPLPPHTLPSLTPTSPLTAAPTRSPVVLSAHPAGRAPQTAVQAQPCSVRAWASQPVQRTAHRAAP